MAPPYTLLSGATGFIGMHILKELLETDHRVRIITRSKEKGEHLRSQFSKHASSIDVALVGDQLAPGAYDEAAKGVEAVIHVASPFTFKVSDVEKELIQPAISMAENMLKAAKKSGTVERVVLTSSVAAVSDPFKGSLFRDFTYTSESWNPIKREQADNPIFGYLASKTIAEQNAWSFIDREKPKFDLVTMCPTLVVGEPLQHVESMQKLNSSCINVYSLFDAKEPSENHMPCMVDVADVAKAHVKALSVKEAGGKRFLLNGGIFDQQLLRDAMRERYPELHERMVEGKPGKGELEGRAIAKLDTTPAQELLGINFAGWYDAVVVKTTSALLKLEKELGGK